MHLGEGLADDMEVGRGMAERDEMRYEKCALIGTYNVLCFLPPQSAQKAL